MARSTLDTAILDPTLEYRDFRTGLTFKDVYQMLAHRKYRRRRGVLGYWHQLKLEAFTEYQRRCAELTARAAASRSSSTRRRRAA